MKIIVTTYSETIGTHAKTYDGADTWHVGGEGYLEVCKNGDAIACHAAGEWSAVEYIGE